MKLPKWMHDNFEKGECPVCKSALSEKGVQSHGIRDEKSKSSKHKMNYTHFYDYKCEKCKQRLVFSFSTSLKDFIQDMQELESAEMPPQLSKEVDDSEELDDNADFIPKKSGISDEEVLELKKVLKGSYGLKEFFAKIGIPLTEVSGKEISENKNDKNK